MRLIISDKKSRIWRQKVKALLISYYEIIVWKLTLIYKWPLSSDIK